VELGTRYDERKNTKGSMSIYKAPSLNLEITTRAKHERNYVLGRSHNEGKTK